jgi:hypothetical protein
VLNWPIEEEEEEEEQQQQQQEEDKYFWRSFLYMKISKIFPVEIGIA